MKSFSRKRRKARGTVLLALPAYSTVMYENWISIEMARFDLQQRKLDCGLIQGRGTYIHEARNNCVIQAYKCPAAWTHLMFIDSDMSFESDLVWNLMQRRVDVVCGAYVQKGYPWWPNAGIMNEDGQTYNMNKPDFTGESGDLIRVDMVGTGLMMIRKEVLDKMQPPWFEHPKLDLEEKDYEQITPIHTKKHRVMGEDVAFCKKVRELGFEIWFDLANEGVHIGSYGYVMADHLEPRVQEAKNEDLKEKEFMPPQEEA